MTVIWPAVRSLSGFGHRLRYLDWRLAAKPSKFAAQFHNRMPVVLELDTWDLWMKDEPDAAAALMKPANEDVLVSRPVSKAVGNVKNNGPELLDLV